MRWVPEDADAEMMKKILMMPIRRGYGQPVQDDGGLPMSFERLQVKAHEYFEDHGGRPESFEFWLREQMTPLELYSFAEFKEVKKRLEQAFVPNGEERVFYECKSDMCAGWL